MRGASAKSTKTKASNSKTMAKELTNKALSAAKGYFHHHPKGQGVWVDGSHCYDGNDVPAHSSAVRVWRKDVMNDEGISTEELIYDAIEAGVLHQNGPWVKYGEHAIGQGIENTIDELDADPQFRADIQQETLQKL